MSYIGVADPSGVVHTPRKKGQSIVCSCGATFPPKEPPLIFRDPQERYEMHLTFEHEVRSHCSPSRAAVLAS